MKLTITLTIISILISLFIPEVRVFLGIEGKTQYNVIKEKTITLYGKDQSMPEFGISYIRINSYPNIDKTDYKLGLDIRVKGLEHSNERIVQSGYKFDYYWNNVNYRIVVLSKDKEAASIKIQISMEIN